MLVDEASRDDSMKRFLLTFGLAAAMVAQDATFWPVLAERASGFQKPQATVSRTEQYLAKMTPAQRAHARYHTKILGLRPDSRSRPLDDLLYHSIITEPGHYVPKPVAEILEDMICTADAVFRGIVASEEVLPTEDGSFLFTDYRVTVTEVLRQRETAHPLPILPRSMVTLTWPGGYVRIEGQIAGAGTSDFPLLKHGDEYVFLAIRVVETGAFTARSGSHVFKLAGSDLTSNRPFAASDLKPDASLKLPGFLQLTRDVKCTGTN